MNIRRATSADIPAMQLLESRTDSAAHWTRQNYEELFRPGATPRRVLVLEERGILLAFVVALAFGTEWEIEMISVCDKVQGTGLGTRLLGELLRQAGEEGSHGVFLEVRESNRAARALYEKWDFSPCGFRRGYYSDPPENAVLYRFRFALPGPASKPVDSK